MAFQSFSVPRAPARRWSRILREIGGWVDHAPGQDENHESRVPTNEATRTYIYAVRWYRQNHPCVQSTRRFVVFG